MTKFLVYLFKLIIPVSFLLWPIIKTFETGWDYALGTSGLILGFLAVKRLWKWFKDVEFKEKHERTIDKNETKATKIKYEAVKGFKYAIFFAIINLTAVFISDINSFAIVIATSYLIGTAIHISQLD